MMTREGWGVRFNGLGEKNSPRFQSGVIFLTDDALLTAHSAWLTAPDT